MVEGNWQQRNTQKPPKSPFSQPAPGALVTRATWGDSALLVEPSQLWARYINTADARVAIRLDRLAQSSQRVEALLREIRDAIRSLEPVPPQQGENLAPWLSNISSTTQQLLRAVRDSTTTSNRWSSLLHNSITAIDQRLASTGPGNPIAAILLHISDVIGAGMPRLR